MTMESASPHTYSWRAVIRVGPDVARVHRIRAPWSLLGAPAILAACVDANVDDPGVDAGAATEPPRAVCDTDFSRLRGAEPVSFEGDIMPIFGRNCAFHVCHARRGPAAGLPLGVTCTFEEDTCVFPLTPEILEEVHAALLQPSATAPGVARVEPGQPGMSFLVDKIAGVQNDRGRDCVPSTSLPQSGPCGSAMPPLDGLCTFEQGQAILDQIAAWILQGAQR
jgi:hypothetical protein